MPDPIQKVHQIPGYELMEEIGSGTYSRVYKARQVSLDRVVAIKILSQDLVAEPGYIDRFHAEGQAAARLNHPNIVGALDVGRAGDTHYLVMEYAQGDTLFEDIEAEESFDELEVIELGLQIARALEHAHEHSLIHRDVKPQNIIIAPDGTAKLADLGMATPVVHRGAKRSEQQDEPAKSGPRKVHGSPYYVSPEQITGKHELDHRTDIYSLGATLYVMATGRAPFDGPTPQAVFKAHLAGELTPPSKYNPTLSQAFDRVVQTCLATDRHRRYESASDLLADLEALEMQEDPLRSAVKLGLGLGDEDDGPARSASASSDAASSITAETFARRREPEELWVQPLFWIAAAGWLMAAVFFALWLMKM